MLKIRFKGFKDKSLMVIVCKAANTCAAMHLLSGRQW